MKAPTGRQAEAFNIIKSFFRNNEYSLTSEEITDDISISVKGVYCHIKQLEEFISCGSNQSHNTARNRRDQQVLILLFSSIATGVPLSTVRKQQRLHHLPNPVVDRDRIFTLHVNENDSMTDAGITDRDIAISNYQTQMENG
ncbi:hypothetical protein S1OALGB6SA_1131 [Olavius algarvensis spirochete endosymbiont]|uniref:LexA family protein n=1 Tax=Olavius algarvensis spirochete endosymbiont TaxID=260710 RepID=UPI000F28225E|nr:hypothetical protein [Olavius algarvensis spirochete endosymbiont]VDB00058.1 hypothetical protein S1OALGB6SA_1131 [Olavius algarvensis spirochete endosymbiont]